MENSDGKKFLSRMISIICALFALGLGLAMFFWGFFNTIPKKDFSQLGIDMILPALIICGIIANFVAASNPLKKSTNSLALLFYVLAALYAFFRGFAGNFGDVLRYLIPVALCIWNFFLIINRNKIVRT
jgi:hypothetical protein